jgi:hypothetical protein
MVIIIILILAVVMALAVGLVCFIPSDEFAYIQSMLVDFCPIIYICFILERRRMKLQIGVCFCSIFIVFLHV